MTDFVLRLEIGGSGPRVAVKDTIDIAGTPTQAGSRALADAPPARLHADVVEAILAAGCRIIGKTVLHEFAYGMTGVNDWAGTPINPLFPDLIPGGSSSGSATAVASGQADFAIGTDTGGSIRLPAACCGIWGFKPTYGRVSRVGIMPAVSSLDCVGPMAASLEQLQIGMAAMDSSFAIPADVAAPVLGVVAVDADPAIADRIAQALAQAGLALRPRDLKDLDAAFQAGMTVINAETWAACGRYLASGLVGSDVAARLARAEATSVADVDAAEAVRRRFTAEIDHALIGVDALVLPTLPRFPMRLADAKAGKIDLHLSSLVRPFNLSGHPSLTLPLPAVDHRPVGLQLVGRKGEDEHLFAIARHFLSAAAQS